MPFSPIYPEEAKLALGVFNALTLVDVLGSPTFGEVTRPWATDFVSQIFGSYNKDTGVREILEYFLLIPKKNTKSTLAAGVMLTALLRNWRKSAEFIILSPTIEIAANSFKPAADAVRADEELSALLHVQDHTRTITHRLTGATLKVVAADSATVGGKKAVGVLVDELWLFGKDLKAEDMLREATGGLVSRDEGFIIYLTTQSNEPPAGVFKQKLDYARDVRDGKIDDPRFLPLLYEFPADMIESGEARDPANFPLVNPNWGASVNGDYITRELQKAIHTSEESVRGMLAKHANIEVGMNLRNDRWPGADFWEDAADPAVVGLETLLDRCEVVAVGIDGGGLDDLLGAAFVGRDRETRQLLATMRAWAHPSVMERRKEIGSVLKDFADADEMVLVDRIGEDTAELATMVAAVHEAGLLCQVGIDPSGVGGILDALLQEGVPEELIVGVNQGWKLFGSIKATERKLAEGVLLHDGSSLMKWCVSNAKVKVTGNAIVVTKQMSGTAKIDPLLALFNAMAIMDRNPPAQHVRYNFDNMVVCG